MGPTVCSVGVTWFLHGTQGTCDAFTPSSKQIMEQQFFFFFAPVQ